MLQTVTDNKEQISLIGVNLNCHLRYNMFAKLLMDRALNLGVGLLNTSFKAIYT